LGKKVLIEKGAFGSGGLESRWGIWSLRLSILERRILLLP
jgi:hypothetical protein